MARKYKKEIIAGLALLILVFALPFFSRSGWGEDEADIDVMLGQMVMVGFRGLGEGAAEPDLDHLLEDIRNGLVGGVVLFEPDYLTKQTRNIKNARQAANLAALLQANAAIPLFIGVDQEGGAVRRFRPEHGFPDTPSAKELAALSAGEVRDHARMLGAALRAAGVNLDFAPVLDVDVNPDSPAIGGRGRAFSSDPEAVARLAGAFAEGLGAEGILYCYKHFPGHGSAGADSHAGFTDVTDTWSEAELAPYRRLLAKDMPGMVMLGHVSHTRYDARHPASLSTYWATEVLRGRLGWDGVAITDDLQMRAVLDEYGEKEAVRLAVNAGVDILLVGGNLVPEPGLGRKYHRYLKELHREDAISSKRVGESYRRIMRLKKIFGDAKMDPAKGE